jgi:hypothetical protein
VIETIRKTPDELRPNDMFKMAGLMYSVSHTEKVPGGYVTVTADHLIGQKTWTIEFTVPHDIPFHIL